MRPTICRCSKSVRNHGLGTSRVELIGTSDRRPDRGRSRAARCRCNCRPAGRIGRTARDRRRRRTVHRATGLVAKNSESATRPAATTATSSVKVRAGIPINWNQGGCAGRRQGTLSASSGPSASGRSRDAAGVRLHAQAAADYASGPTRSVQPWSWRSAGRKTHIQGRWGIALAALETSRR